MMPQDEFAASAHRHIALKELPSSSQKQDAERASVSGSDGESSGDEAPADAQSKKRKRSMKISYVLKEAILSR